MERPRSSDDDDDKLIPEWGVAADDQVILAGLAAFLGLVLFFGWNLWQGRDGEAESTTATTLSVDTRAAADAAEFDAGASAGVVVAAPADADAGAAVTTDDVPASPTTIEEITTTVGDASATVGDVQGAVATLAGDISGTADGTVAVLNGFVANEAESAEAEEAAAAVEGIESVENNLQILEPQALQALTDAGVVGPSVLGTGTVMDVTGTIQSEDERQPALDAVAAVNGVTSVNDMLTVSVAADLNDIEQVQFATGSADILPVSFPDLDAAVALIQAAPETTQLEIQGFTDVRGDDAANLQLSQDRADAVRQYLIDAGVDGERLNAVGNGETERFAAGDSPEALALNRVVRFVQTG